MYEGGAISRQGAVLLLAILASPSTMRRGRHRGVLFYNQDDQTIWPRRTWKVMKTLGQEVFSLTGIDWEK